MNRLKAIIVDDERPARKELIFLLKDFSAITIVGEADCLNRAKELILEHKPDLVFLDIQLAGENGFDLLADIPVSFRVVFVTAFNEFAIKAFDVNAADYLLKPVDPERLKITINRLLETNDEQQIIKKKFAYSDSIYVKQSNCSAKFIEVNSIVAISSLGNHSRIETLDGGRYIVLKTLKLWESELPESYFIRIHRSTIVNIKCILKVHNYSKTYHQVFMQGIEDPFEVSRSCFKNLRKINA